jgi:putative spermidine/putrescine transport system ATP-binding protein
VPKADIASRVGDVLNLVGLTHHAKSRPAQISGGEQQRAALARALVRRPAVLLLDEPLSNLDAKLKERVREEIRTIQRRLDITTVLVTHDQEEALAVSDRVAVMNQGKVEQLDVPTELYRRPQTEFVATFIGASNWLLAIPGHDSADRTVWMVRPEHVRLSSTGTAGTVTRVLPHGHFFEVGITLDAGAGAHTADGLGEVRAYVSGAVPGLGEPVHVEFVEALRYVDGLLSQPPTRREPQPVAA